MDRLERLVNLVIALRETRHPMTAREVHDRVAGYGHSGAPAFRRMFERDKADLRALGVPVETVAVGAWEEEIGYRIDPARYDLPDLRLEPRELAALALAVEATGLGDEAGGGLRKLEVDAGDPPPWPDPSAPLNIDVDSPHRATLIEAAVTRTPVRFAYRPPGRAPAERDLDPHALVHRRGRWYVVGHDHARGERRAFRLDRIEGGVRRAGPPGAFDPPDGIRVDDVVPATAAGPETAEVLAAPHVAWQVARRARGGGRPARVAGEEWTAFTVAVGDPDEFIGWALEHGPDLVVSAPPELRDAVTHRLSTVADGTR